MLTRWIALSAAALCLAAGPRPLAAETFLVLTQADYEAETGCSTGFYNYSLTRALDYLVFPEAREDNPIADDVHYARRHTRALFGDLLASHADAGGTLEDRCLPPSLKQIALALRLLSPDGRYRGAEAPINHVYAADAATTGAPSPRAYPVMPRRDYIEKTGCLVSPSSYDNYRFALYASVLGHGGIGAGRESMRAFLRDLFDSRPTAEGVVADACMTDAIARVAAGLGLLDAEGRYRAEP